MKSGTRSRRTSSFTWNGDSHASMRPKPLSQRPDLESSNETSADDFSDVATDNDEDPGRQRFQFRGGTPALQASYESDLSDADDRKRLNRESSSLGKVNYDSDSCLTPRSRRTVRRMLSTAGAMEPRLSAKPPSKPPALDTILDSPTHEILHPLQSLRLERSLSMCREQSLSMRLERSLSMRLGRSLSSKTMAVSNEFLTKVYRTSVTFETFTLPKPQSMEPSFKPKATPGTFDSYTFPRNSVEYEGFKFPKPCQSTVATPVQEEKLEQKQCLALGDADSNSLSTVNEVETPRAPAPNVVVIIVDAEKKLTFIALDYAIAVAVRPGDEIVILGVLKHTFSPMGYKMVANTDPLYGVNREFLQLKVNKTAESFESELSESGRREECEKKKVKLSVRIAPGARARTVVVRELQALGATYAIFDRKAMSSRRYYGKNLSCHAVRMRRNGRSTKTITLVQQKTPANSRSPTSECISSVSPTRTDYGILSSNKSSSRSPTLWRRITNFGTRHTTSPRSSRTLDLIPSDVPRGYT